MHRDCQYWPASAAVLLAAIGLSRQLFDNEYPSLSTPAYKEEYERGYAQSQEAPKRSGERTHSPLNIDHSDLYANRLETGDKAESIRGGHASAGQVSVDEIEESRLRTGKIATGRPEEEKDLFDAKLKSAVNPVRIAGAMQKGQLPSSELVVDTGAEASRKPAGREQQLLNKMDADGASRSLTENFEDSYVGDDNLVLANSRTKVTDYEETRDTIYRDEISQLQREAGHKQAQTKQDQSRQNADKKLKNIPAVPRAGSPLELASELSGGFSLQVQQLLS